MAQVIQTQEQQYYLTKLMGFDYEIIYRSGKSNGVADALSMKELMDSQLNSLTTLSNPIIAAIRKANTEEGSMKSWHEQFSNGELGPDYSVKDGLLFFQNRIMVPESYELKRDIFKMYHEVPIAGHGGLQKTYKAVSETFYWPKMQQEIEELIKQCESCQQVKYNTTKKQGTLQPLPIPTKPWQDITMDFITGLPNSHGNVAILVVVDRFTKQAHFVALALGYTASVVAEKFVQHVVRLHGFPRSVVSDRDPLFTSKFWKHLMQFSGTKLHHSTAYHPEFDEQFEVVNRCLEQYLRLYVHSQPQQWYKFLTWAELWYNSSYHSSIKMSPYEAVYGVKPNLLPGYNSGEANVETVDELLQLREKIHQLLKENLQRAQLRMKK